MVHLSVDERDIDLPVWLQLLQYVMKKSPHHVQSQLIDHTDEVDGVYVGLGRGRQCLHKALLEDTIVDVRRLGRDFCCLDAFCINFKAIDRGPGTASSKSFR